MNTSGKSQNNEHIDSKTSGKPTRRLKAKPIPNEVSIQLLREMLQRRARDLLLFDLATQTGVRLSKLLKLQVKDLAGLGVGDRLPLDPPTAKGGLVRMTQILLTSYQGYLEAEQPEWDDFLFKSRKRSRPLNLTSASEMVTRWFRNAGLTELVGSRSLRSTWEVYYRDAIAKEMQSDATEPNLVSLDAHHLLDRVHETILQRIVSGQYRPGEQLLPSQVAKEIGTSSKVIREAFLRLEGAGFFSGRERNCFVVADLSREDLMDICDLRLAVESLALEKAYLIRSEETLQRLENRLEVMSQYAEENYWEAFLDVHEDFHLTLCADANMPVVQQTLRDLMSRLRPYMRMTGPEKPLEFDVDDHRGMLEGLRNQDLDTVLLNLKKDLSTARQLTAERVHGRRSDRKRFRVGMAYNFRGPARSVSIPIFNGCRMVADHINSQGGLTIGGHKYEIVFQEIDLGFTYEGAVATGRRLLEKDGVDLIVGGLVTQTSRGLQTATAPAKKITLSTGLGDEVISRDKGGRYTFRSFIGPREILPGMFHWLRRNHPQAEKIVMIDLDYESAWRAHEMVEEIAGSFGLSIVYRAFYPLRTKDFSSWLTEALKEDPDVMINVASFTDEWALRIRQARELGYTGLFMDAILPSANVLLSLAGIANIKGLVGIGFQTQGPSAGSNIRRFKRDYTRIYGSWSAAPLLVAPAFEVILRAFEAAGSLDADKVSKILESGRVWDTWIGISGQFDCGHRYGQPHQWTSTQWLHQVNHGELVPLRDGRISRADMRNGWEKTLAGKMG